MVKELDYLSPTQDDSMKSQKTQSDRDEDIVDSRKPNVKSKLLATQNERKKKKKMSAEMASEMMTQREESLGSDIGLLTTQASYLDSGKNMKTAEKVENDGLASLISNDSTKGFVRTASLSANNDNHVYSNIEQHPNNASGTPPTQLPPDMETAKEDYLTRNDNTFEY